MQPEWRKWLSETLNTAVRFDEPMAAHTALGVGGPAWAYAAPESLSQLRILVKGAAQRQIPCWVIGSGSNLLVRDRGIPGLVICLHRCLSRIEETGRGRKVMVSAMAGVRLPVLCGYAQRRGFAGLEFAWGIPGTVGGAVFMNAGTASNKHCPSRTEGFPARFRTGTGEGRSFWRPHWACGRKIPAFSERKPFVFCARDAKHNRFRQKAPAVSSRIRSAGKPPANFWIGPV